MKNSAMTWRAPAGQIGVDLRVHPVGEGAAPDLEEQETTCQGDPPRTDELAMVRVPTLQGAAETHPTCSARTTTGATIAVSRIVAAQRPTMTVAARRAAD